MESEYQSSSSHQGESEGPCLIVEASQKEDDIPGVSSKQKMLWEMTALTGDTRISPVLEQVKHAETSPKIGKKDTEKTSPVVATTASTSSSTLPWTITKMPSIPPRAKDSNSSSSSSSSMYPGSVLDTSSSRSKLESSTSSSSIEMRSKPHQTRSKSRKLGQGQSTRMAALDKDTSDEQISPSQEDMFTDAKAESRETTRHPLIGTPSETIPSLQLSGQVKIYANETSMSEGSSNVIDPSPEAWGPVPVCIPSTPTPEEEEPMDVSLEYSEGDPQAQQEDTTGFVIAETQAMGESQQPQQRERRTKTKGGESDSDEDEMEIPEWQQALNREEEAAAAAASQSRSSSCGSSKTSSIEQSAQSDQWGKQSESLAAQQLQQDDESARSRPGSSNRSRPGSSAKSSVVKDTAARNTATNPQVTTGADITTAEKPHTMKKSDEHKEPTEPQFSQDLFHPEVPVEAEASEPVEIAQVQVIRGSSQTKTAQPVTTEAEKQPSDDWSLRLTPSQSETQSQAGVFTTTTVSSPLKVQQQQKQAEQSKATGSSQKSTQAKDKQGVSELQRSETPEVSRASEGSPWDGNISSVPRQESADPFSQSSSIGFHLSLPTDSGIRPITSATPPDKAKKSKHSSRRQPLHSTPIMEEDTQTKDQESTHGVKVQHPAQTLTLEEGMESQQQASDELPRFRLEKPSDTDQLVKTAKESPVKQSTSVCARVQEIKAATVPRKARKKIYSGTDTSEDPFADLPSVTRTRSTGDQPQEGSPDVVEIERPAAEEESMIDPEAETRIGHGGEQPAEDVEVDDSDTIPMVYDEPSTTTAAVTEPTAVATPAATPAVAVQETSVEHSVKSGTKRGKKGGRGKKRKKPTQKKSADSVQTGANTSNSDIPQSKQQRVERDPYEWTESQSNKTPTPLKLRRGADTDTTVILPRRRLNEPEQSVGDVDVNVGAGTSAGVREATGGADKEKDGAPQDTSPKGTGAGEGGGGGGGMSPSKQQTPPVGDGSHDRSHDRGSSGGDSDRSPDSRSPEKITTHVKTITIKILQVTRVVIEKVYKGTQIISVNEQVITEEPVEERTEEEHCSPSLESSTSTSLSSGTLADISSLSTSKSSSGTPSLTKTSSSSSAHSNATKSSTISSISNIDSSLGKVVSSPGSKQTSPTTPKMGGRSVSFQDEQPEHKSPPKESTSRSPDRTGKKSSLVRSHTEPVTSPTEPASLLTRSRTDVSTPRQQKDSGASGKDRTGKKSIFPKSYSTPSKHLRTRTAGNNKDTPKERGRKQKLPADKSPKDTDGEEEGQKRPLRRRRSRSGQKSGSKSPADPKSPPDQKSQPDPKSPPDHRAAEEATTLPISPPQDEPSAVGGAVQSEGVLVPRSSTSGPSSSMSKSSSSKTGEILGSPPQEPTSPGTDTSGQLKPGVRVIAKWMDNHYYSGKIVKPTNDNKYEVEFDDGDVRNVLEKNIILKEWLSKGQSVFAEREDGFSYAGVVVGYYNNKESGSQGYVVETDQDQDTGRYSRGKVILTKDQAAALVVSSSGSGASSSEINLDNIVSGKRTRGRFVLSPSGSPRGRARVRASGQSGTEKPQSPQPSTSGQTAQPSTSGNTPKRKLGSRSDSPSPKRSKATPTPEAPVSPRRSPRKNPQATRSASAITSPSSSPASSRFASIDERAQAMGPLPTNKTLFKGLAFLITSHSGKLQKKTIRALLFAGQSPSSSTDESGHEEETEVPPIDKNYAKEQIQRGGGIVCNTFDKSQMTKCKVYLISNTYVRTTKYLQALAAGIPCLSHLWLRQCINANKIQSFDAYLLPAGVGLDDRTIIEQQPHTTILAGMHIFVVSTIEGNEENWRSVLIAAGCQIVKRLPTQLLRKGGQGMAFACNVIVTDYTCPKHILDKALQLHIPVVSIEWLVQSLINSKRLPYKDSYKFTWDYRDPAL